MAEGAAGGGEEDAPDGLVLAAHALPHGAGLAVDGQDLDAVSVRLRHDDVARHDDDFLVGEGDALPGVERLERGLEALAADRPDHDGVDVFAPDHFLHGGVRPAVGMEVGVADAAYVVEELGLELLHLLVE